MKRHAVLTLLTLCAIAAAQYELLWESEEIGFPQSIHVVGIQNTDLDPQPELVFRGEEPLREGYLYLWALDLLTGETEEVTDEFYSIYAEPGREPRLVDVDGDGRYEILFLAQSEAGDLPAWYLYGVSASSGNGVRKYTRLRGPRLGQNTPNPLNKKTRIDFDLPTPGRAAITIFDQAGRQVRRIETGRLEAGQHSVDWSRDDASGLLVPAGAYFYELEAAGQKTTRKALVVE